MPRISDEARYRFEIAVVPKTVSATRALRISDERERAWSDCSTQDDFLEIQKKNWLTKTVTPGQSRE
jgi:hypothetical protein